MTRVYHLDLDPDAAEGSELALLPGDPGRVPRLARAVDAGAREIGWRREFRSFLAHVGGRGVLVTSTGIGGPSTSIAVEELARLGVRTFLRVGTTGSIQPRIDAGHVIITAGAVRRDGASADYAPIEYPAVAHHEVLNALVAAARERGTAFHVGITVSSATFYPGEERGDTFGGGTLRRLRGATEEWRRLGVLSYEMEAATLLTMCGVLSLRGGCVAGVVNAAGGRIDEDRLERGEAAVWRGRPRFDFVWPGQ
jgi:uridine phosphorylase